MSQATIRPVPISWSPWTSSTVSALLDRHEIRYWVESAAISIDVGPEIAFVNFGRTGDRDRIQAILDEAK